MGVRPRAHAVQGGHLAGAPGVAMGTGNISAVELVSILHDTVIELKDFQGTAFMANCHATSTAKLPPSLSNLRAVDIFDDPGVWATLDEGCNACCHGRAWARNAEDKFDALGYHPEWVHRETKTYNGIGSRRLRRNTSSNHRLAGLVLSFQL